MIKADAYGLGLEQVGRALHAAGCKRFFVARLDEGIALREALGGSADIYVLDGLASPEVADACEAGQLIPVLNTPEDIALWTARARNAGAARRAILAVDTGMARLGLTPAEARSLKEDSLRGLDIDFVMSHLACADEPDHPMNERQRLLFDELRGTLPATPASFANSAGIFLGPAYRYQLTRPGAAVFGIGNKTRQVVRLKARILQVRVVESDTTVGYDATRRVPKGTRLATVAAGYADGYLRSLSNRGHGYLDGARVPVAGVVSMDLATFDVSKVPEAAARPGAHIDLICDRYTVDDLAEEAGTIGYEILTALGRRYERRYLP